MLLSLLEVGRFILQTVDSGFGLFEYSLNETGAATLNTKYAEKLFKSLP